MFDQLTWFNEAVGKATLEDIYAMTPREFDSIVAGGLKRSYNALSSERFALSNTVLPVAMIDPDKFDDSEVKKVLAERLKSIEAMTDKKLQKKLQHQKQQQQRFMDIFMPDNKKGGKN